MPRTHLLTILITTLLVVRPAAAEIQEYTEDFRSWQQRDPAFTTALWDTTAGELRLPPKPLGARGTLNTLGTAYAVVRSGAHLLVADGAGGLLAIDPADPDQPVQVDQLALADQARGLAVAGTWAYVAVGGAGLQAVNAADPTDLLAGGVADGPGYAQGVAVAGGWAYVAQGAAGVGVFDLAAPGAPSHRVDLAAGDFVRSVAVGGGRLLAADGARGLRIYSLADPAQPAPVDSVDTPGNCQGVALVGGLAYLADGAGGLQVMDLDAAGGAALVAGLALPGTAMSVTVAGDTLLVAGGDGGLHLVDVTVPTAPQLVGTAPSLNWAYRGLPLGDEVWLADGAAGLRAFTADPYGLDEGAAAARSLDLNPGTDPVLRARLSADYEDSVFFFLSADGGGTWSSVAADGSWLDFPAPVQDVRWRVRLAVADGWPGPVVRSLTVGLDRAVSHAVITGVTDVPDDGGGQVRLRWLASRHDAAGGQHLVTGYSIYRRIDAGKRWPAGEWEYLLTVPADREAEYAAVAPTLHDATAGDPGLVGLLRAHPHQRAGRLLRLPARQRPVAGQPAAGAADRVRDRPQQRPGHRPELGPVGGAGLRPLPPLPQRAGRRAARTADPVAGHDRHQLAGSQPRVLALRPDRGRHQRPREPARGRGQRRTDGRRRPGAGPGHAQPQQPDHGGAISRCRTAAPRCGSRSTTPGGGWSGCWPRAGSTAVPSCGSGTAATGRAGARPPASTPCASMAPAGRSR